MIPQSICLCLFAVISTHPWMERAAEEVLEEAEVRLWEALWVARHSADIGVGRYLAPAVWNHLRGYRSSTRLRGRKNRDCEILCGTSTPSRLNTNPRPQHFPRSSHICPSCPICFEQATQILRPCGHIICVTCLDRIGRCPICNAGFSHSLNILINLG